MEKVAALKNILLETIKLDSELFKRIVALEVEWDAKFQELFKQRSEILEGKPPTDSQKVWKYPSEFEMNEPDIQDFWLNVLKNVDDELIYECDHEVLKHLKDVKYEYLSTDKSAFKLSFHFAKNNFFKNEVLTKTYYQSFDLDESNPLDYEGPWISALEGCKIEWYEGKDITMKQVKRRSSKEKPPRPVKRDSFFNFFNHEKVVVTLDNAIDYECDIENGQFFKDEIIPKAILFYTKEYEVFEDDSEFLSDEEESDVSSENEE